MSSAAEIVFDHVTKRYAGRDAAAVNDLSFEIPAGTIVPEPLFIRHTGYNRLLEAEHYQIESTNRLTRLDAFKGALDNLARNAVVRAAVGYTGLGDPRGLARSDGVSEATVGELLGRILRDSAFAARLKADPDAVLALLDLTDAERATILAGLRATGGGAPLAPRPRMAGRIV